MKTTTIFVRALQTAAVQWRRGAREDAIAWLRRGADAAVDGGVWERASQLNVIASQLEKAIAGGEELAVPAAPSSPKFPPRAPTPASHSVVPQSFRSGLPTAPTSTRAPESHPVSPNSRWPTGFPASAAASATPSGRAIAPPPPLPASVRVPKAAPIPPRPKSAIARDSNRLSPDIQLGVEELDMSDAELVELQEDITIRSRITADVSRGGQLESPANSTRAPNSLPSYELDEDPMDGTTALPQQPTYSVSYAPDSMDDQALPAFPLEDSVPAGPPSMPPQVPTTLRTSSLPQISVSRLSSVAPVSAPQPLSSQPPRGTQKFFAPGFPR